MKRVHSTVTKRVLRAQDVPAPRWVARLFLVMAIALLPWIAYLAISLPSRTVADHYRTAWVGFDILLVIVLARTAMLALQGRPQMQLPAVATATLLLVDAWFDVTTSHPGWPQIEAILLAVFVELPTAGLAIYISRRVERVVEERLEQVRTEYPSSSPPPKTAPEDATIARAHGRASKPA